MTRVGKYMVYNPRKDKPIKFYNSYNSAYADAERLNDKENTDVLILKVVGNVENTKHKFLNNEFKMAHFRELIKVGENNVLF